MDETKQELLAQLRDIHAAADPGWWPPAPGWWVLALLAAGALFYILRHAYRAWQALRRRRRLLDALAEIQRETDAEQNPHEFLARINRLFRVVALRAFPGTACRRLQGDEWVDFIRALLPETIPTESLSSLASGPYEAGAGCDAAGLGQAAHAWVKKYG